MLFFVVKYNKILICSDGKIHFFIMKNNNGPTSKKVSYITMNM